jgi:hypothetical protein
VSVLQSQPVAVVLLALTTLVVLGVLLAVEFRRPGPGRAGLVGGGVALALLPLTLAVGWSSWRLIRVISQGAQEGMSGTALVPVIRDLWSLQRLAWGGVAVLCGVALILGVVRRGAGAEAPACSVGRALVIVLLPLIALAGTATLSREIYKALRITAAVIVPTDDNPASHQPAEAVLAAEGLATKQPGQIHAISARIARGTIRGVLGSIALAILLSGLFALGLSLAWRVKPPLALVAASAALWVLLGLAAALLAGGLVDPLRGLVT